GAIVKYTLARVAQTGVDSYRVVSRHVQKLRADNLDPLVVSNWPNAFASAHIAVDHEQSDRVYVSIPDNAQTGPASLLTYKADLSRDDTDALQRRFVWDLWATNGLVGFLSSSTYGGARKLEVVQDVGTQFKVYDESPEVSDAQNFAVEQTD